MFKGRVISRSNVNGKVHTFQKDFDDYDAYRTFLDENPDFLPRAYLGDWWSPWKTWNPLLSEFEEVRSLPADVRHLPEGVDLQKYEKRRLEKRQSESEKLLRKQSLESTEAYLKDYLEENPSDDEAKGDLEKVQKELQSLA
ncbi:MAG: hypothetical protein HHAS10_01620 [Candidatus Altimarinota bacterium]